MAHGPQALLRKHLAWDRGTVKKTTVHWHVPAGEEHIASHEPGLFLGLVNASHEPGLFLGLVNVVISRTSELGNERCRLPASRVTFAASHKQLFA